LELVDEVEALGKGLEEPVDLFFEVVGVDCVLDSSDGEFDFFSFFLQFFHHFLVLFWIFCWRFGVLLEHHSSGEVDCLLRVFLKNSSQFETFESDVGLVFAS
jgi:hypothetical protein